MKGLKIHYSEQELAFVKANCTLAIKELYAAFCQAFTRPEITANNLKSLRTRKGWKTGRTGQFKKGNIPHPDARPKGPNKTSFKKGHVPPNSQPLYSERITKDGYIEIKVPEENPYNGSTSRYRLKHQVIWEKENDPVPEGYILHFIDGDRTNCDPSNLEIFPRGVGAIMNKKKYSSMPDEIKPALKTLAKLQYRHYELRQKEQS
tara:strand:+ start:8337 stop:8951 length:615 start_codon:yes stop_codon:yes gene_type:complete